MVDPPGVAEYLAVAAIGAGVGSSELVSRYRDAPMSALGSWPAAIYLAINAAAAVAALLLIDAFGWSFGFSEGEETAIARVLVAGFGAMALFRSSLFLVRIGDADVGIGPATMLSSLLDAAERGVDRTRAKRRAKKIREIVSGLDYATAGPALPALSLGLVQNPTADDQRRLAEAVRNIEKTNFSGEVKLDLLGLALLTFGGESVLSGAVELLDR